MKLYFLLFIAGFYLTSCHENKPAEIPKEKPKLLIKDTLQGFDLTNELISHFNNSIQLDTLLTQITNQELVKVVAELTESWDDNKKIYSYSDSNYDFKLKVIGSINSGNTNTIFFDGKRKISFKDYHPICLKEGKYSCENYGFNYDNTLDKPKIIEVCGKRFFYSNVIYHCNGIGCGCNITFIYDLETHNPFFLENYRLPFDGFFISDFDYDNNPDILVISQTGESKMKGFDVEEFEVKLTPYSYSNKTFKAKWDNRFQRQFCYELYSVTSDYHHSYHTEGIYSITKDNWLRP